MTTLEEAEKAVLGAALIDPESLRFALDHITPDDFADKRLGKLFSIMVGLRSARLPLDPWSVLQAANDRGIKVDGVQLLDLRESTPTASNADYYARIVAEQAVRRRLEMAGARFMQLSGQSAELTEIMQNARAEWDSVRGAVASTMVAKPLSEILDGTDEYDWLIPDLIERMDRVVITGGEGAGKSTLVRQIAVLASAGVHPMAFTPIAPLRVLVVDAENTEKQWRRNARGIAVQARSHGSANPGETLRIACLPRVDITTDRDLGAIHRLVDEHEPDMLMIGPLYRLIPRAINNDDDAAPLLAALDTLRARGLAMVMEAHAGHAQTAKGTRDLRPRGSAALMGWPEFGFGIAMDPTDESRTLANLVRWRGDRDQRAWPENFRRGGAWPWMDDNPTATAYAVERHRRAS